MMGGFFEANVEALAESLPGLALLLREARAEGPVYEGIATISGAVSAKLPPEFGGRLVHSAREPWVEASRLAAAFPPAADTALVLGFGLGYGSEALLKSSLASRVLVCEASASLLASALDLRDLRGLLRDGRLSFIVGGPPEALVGYLDEVGARRLSILPNRALELAFPDWYASLRQAGDRYASKEGINENTLKRFGRLWVRNLAHNLPLVGRLPGTRHLEASFQGYPALVLAAGPSLDDVLPHLAKLRERCLLVCVDTALRSVLRVGVEPDFLVVVDPQYWNWCHLEGLSSPSSILVSESAAWPGVLRFSARATFLCGSLFPLGLAVEARAGAKGRLGAGGSVATTAWDFARVLGASPVYLAGLDLGFPSGETHAKASLFEQRSLATGRRLAPAETGQAAALFSAGPGWTLDAAGRPLRSDQRMALYAWWFESRLGRPSSPQTLRVGDRGRAIPGLGSAPIHELLALAPCRPRLDETLERIAAIKEDPASLQGAQAGLAELLERLHVARDLASEALALSAKARASLTLGGDPRPALEALDACDARLSETGIGDILGFLLPPLPEILGERARSLEEGLAASERLYSGIAESANFHLEALGQPTEPEEWEKCDKI